MKKSNAKFQPAKGKLLVRRAPEEKVTKGGIEIVESAREKPQEGTVIASHPENVYRVTAIVLYGRYAGTDVKLNDEMLLLLSEDDVLGTLEK